MIERGCKVEAAAGKLGFAIWERLGPVYYFNGHLPVFMHEERNLAAFRMFTTLLVINGNATQAQI